MTLVLGLPVKGGFVLASDGQVTIGGLKMTTKKIKELNGNCIWGAAGDTTLIDRVEEGINKIANKEMSLQNLCTPLCDIIPKCVGDLAAPPGKEFVPPEGIFVFVEYRDNPRILFVRENGGMSWQPSNIPFAVGSGYTFAYTLLRKYQDLIANQIDVELTKLLAYKVIAETIEIVEGVGLPIDVWLIPPAKNLTKAELSGLEDSYNGLREAEIQMFLTKKK